MDQHTADQVELFEEITKGYLRDLSYIPEDKLGVSPIGAARSPLAFTAECIGFNMLVADVLEGKPFQTPEPDAMAAFACSIDTSEKARDGIQASSQRIIALLKGMSSEELAAPATTPWGTPLNNLKLAGMAAHHMNYHDGQLNYIQALYGDAEDHWS